MKKIGIVTPYKGYNFGTSLQAYAIKQFITSLNYDPYMVGKVSISKGRDINIKKLFTIFFRGIVRPKVLINTLFSYKHVMNTALSERTKKNFLLFQEKLNIHEHTYSQLKRMAKYDFVICICGSDQIWNATNLYLDPMYYLQFAPKEKRIAFAPSFGKSYIPNYNKAPIKKRINKFKKISVREDTGVKIISDLIGKKADCLIDPTFLLKKNEWMNMVGDFQIDYENVVILYFLDTPSKFVFDLLDKLRDQDYTFLCLNYFYEGFSKYNVIKVDAGPIEFVKYILNAKLILTDSFHGTVFSINFHKNFYVFNRNYRNAQNQSTRITSILSKCGLEDRLVNEQITKITQISKTQFQMIDTFLLEEREHAKKYIVEAVHANKE